MDRRPAFPDTTAPTRRYLFVDRPAQSRQGCASAAQAGSLRLRQHAGQVGNLGSRDVLPVNSYFGKRAVQFDDTLASTGSHGKELHKPRRRAGLPLANGAAGPCSSAWCNRGAIPSRCGIHLALWLTPQRPSREHPGSEVFHGGISANAQTGPASSASVAELPGHYPASLSVVPRYDRQ